MDINRLVCNKKLQNCLCSHWHAKAGLHVGSRRGWGWWVPKQPDRVTDCLGYSGFCSGATRETGFIRCTTEEEQENKATWLVILCCTIISSLSPAFVTYYKRTGTAWKQLERFFYDYIMQLLKVSFFCRTNIISHPFSLTHWSTSFVSSVVTYWLGLPAFFWSQSTFELFHSVLWTQLYSVNMRPMFVLSACIADGVTAILLDENASMSQGWGGINVMGWVIIVPFGG